MATLAGHVTHWATPTKAARLCFTAGVGTESVLATRSARGPTATLLEQTSPWWN